MGVTESVLKISALPAPDGFQYFSHRSCSSFSLLKPRRYSSSASFFGFLPLSYPFEIGYWWHLSFYASLITIHTQGDYVGTPRIVAPIFIRWLGATHLRVSLYAKTFAYQWLILITFDPMNVARFVASKCFFFTHPASQFTVFSCRKFSPCSVPFSRAVHEYHHHNMAAAASYSGLLLGGARGLGHHTSHHAAHHAHAAASYKEWTSATPSQSLVDASSAPPYPHGHYAPLSGK